MTTAEQIRKLCDCLNTLTATMDELIGQISPHSDFYDIWRSERNGILRELKELGYERNERTDF